MDDYINRQAAIDLVRDVCDAVMSGCESWYDPETEDEVYKDIREVDAILKCNKEVRIALRNMPSAQPDVPDATVGDMISRQATINTLIRESQVDGAYGYLDTKSIVDALKRMPSADVAEVVRCKDCIYHEPGTEELDAWCNVWGNTTICDGYCFYGEQKSEG